MLGTVSIAADIKKPLKFGAILMQPTKRNDPLGSVRSGTSSPLHTPSTPSTLSALGASPISEAGVKLLREQADDSPNLEALDHDDDLSPPATEPACDPRFQTPFAPFAPFAPNQNNVNVHVSAR